VLPGGNLGVGSIELPAEGTVLPAPLPVSVASEPVCGAEPVVSVIFLLSLTAILPSPAPIGRGPPSIRRPVAADGGDFSYGGAVFYGSMGNTHLNTPVAGIASSAGGSGYWLVGADGGDFSSGDAMFHGSLVNSGTQLNHPIGAIAAESDGGGLLVVTRADAANRDHPGLGM
jgi:hypothetical protein